MDQLVLEGFATAFSGDASMYVLLGSLLILGF